MPEIPDFADASWQKRRNDAQLLASILDGKGPDMPPWRRKISEQQARDLVAHVRAFGPNTEKSGKKKQQEPAPADFDESFRRLQEQLDELRKQFQDLSEPSPCAAPSKLTESSQDKVTDPVPFPNVCELFREHCVKCHGADGTGGQARDRLAKIPNLTDVSWQKHRDDAQLLASILDGKGRDMPPAREKISEKQARELVAYVRAFARTKAKPEGSSQSGFSRRDPDPEEGQEATIQVDDAEAKPASGLQRESGP